MRTIGEVAELAGVSVRTLRHYDELGLLVPSERSDAGYRLYDHADLVRLQEILVWRQLGFPLADIAAIQDAPHHDRITALQRQRSLAERERERLEAVIRALDAALIAHRNGTKLEEAAMFDGFDHEQYEAEARERWGHTEAYAQSSRRTAGYTEQDWSAIRAESEEITRAFAELHQSGEPPSSPAARTTAERHRQHITQWFYPCSSAMHCGLADMYVADERFARNYDGVAPGLAAYVREAIVANAT
jgi:MerR family transcriptional regulator, thiopeptide resistance regulator